jgi:hypothetical protein
MDWPTPYGLQAQLGMNRTTAQAELAAMPFDFGFPLRDYQQHTIQAVEAALATDGRRTMLLAMATGTGKTRLAMVRCPPVFGLNQVISLLVWTATSRCAAGALPQACRISGFAS